MQGRVRGYLEASRIPGISTRCQDEREVFGHQHKGRDFFLLMEYAWDFQKWERLRRRVSAFQYIDDFKWFN
jgi:hypothetical protein